MVQQAPSVCLPEDIFIIDESLIATVVKVPVCAPPSATTSLPERTLRMSSAEASVPGSVRPGISQAIVVAR